MARSMHDRKLAVALTRCFYCGEPDRIALNSLLTEAQARAVDAMDGCVIDLEPCAKCAEHMKAGVVLVTIDPAKSDPGWDTAPADPGERKRWMPNPYRTGGYFVVKDEAIVRLMGEESARWYIEHRWGFIEHAAAEQWGLFAAAAGAQPTEEAGS